MAAVVSLHFSGCSLEVEARRLFRGRHEVHCSPKALDTLITLVENRPRAMSKTELLEQVWPDVNVSEVSLARVVSELRRALGDGRMGHIIRTVHSYGYAFAAKIDDADALQPSRTGRKHPAGWLISATRSMPLYEGEQLIGREPGLETYLDSPKVSRRHACISIRGDHATIEDLGSKNGSFVKNIRIAAPTPLRHGDEVRFGLFTCVFRLERSAGSTETA
jgi:DNA-binding winged helix-turn-helix (wHTH) protein